MGDNSVLLAKWKEGDNEAFAKIWEVFYPKLVRYAEGRMLHLKKREMDGEDIALSAMHSFCRAKERNAFHTLDSSEDLFKILYVFVQRKISTQGKREGADIRGGGETRGESVFVNAAGEQHGGLSEAAVVEVTHEEVVEYHEELERRLAGLNDPKAKQVLALTLESYTNEEIATKMGVSLRTVERKLKKLREAWSKELD